MQRKNKRSTEKRRMSEEKLRKAKQHHILNILLAEYLIENEGEAAEKAACFIMKTTPPTLRQWRRGETNAPAEKMFELQKAAGSTIWTEWLTAQSNKYQ